jgi:phytoene dehydrogenase-like protein
MGIKVKLFEANGKIGGCCATTNVGGCTFNDGALHLALPKMLDHVFALVALDRPTVQEIADIQAQIAAQEWELR